MKTNDTAEPRYKLAKAKATEVWKTLGQGKIPVQINDIVKALDIPVSEQDLNIYGIARLHTNGTFYISFKKQMSTERKRFTVAHELGHIILEHITFTGESSQYSTISQEKEADCFAGNLLIPIDDLKKFMKNKDKSIEDVMNRYWVSKSAALVAIKGNRLLNHIYIK